MGDDGDSSSSTGLDASSLLAPSLDPAYAIESAVLQAVTALSLLIAALLVLSSMPRWATKPIATSKRFFHCVVTLCAMLNVVKAIDSQQALDRFGTDAYITIFLTNNITCCLMLGGAVLIYNTIDVQHRINKSPTPPALPFLLAALSVINFIFINVNTALAVTQLKQLYYQYILFYMISSFSVLIIIADISVWNVRSLVLKYQDRSLTVRSKVLAAEKSLYPLYAFVIFLNFMLIAVIAALSYQANLIRTKNRYSLPPDRANLGHWTLDVFAWVHCVAIALFIWWSWVPIEVLRPVMQRLGYAQHTDVDNVQVINQNNQNNNKDEAGGGGAGAGEGAAGTRASPNRVATMMTATKGPLMMVPRTSVAGLVGDSGTSWARGSGSHGRLYQAALAGHANRRVSPALGPMHTPTPAPLHPGPINGTPLQLGPAAVSTSIAAASAAAPAASAPVSLAAAAPPLPADSSAPDGDQRKLSVNPSDSRQHSGSAVASARVSGRGRFVSKQADDIVGEQSLSREDLRGSGQSSPLLASALASHQASLVGGQLSPAHTAAVAPPSLAALRLPAPSRRGSAASSDALPPTHGSTPAGAGAAAASSSSASSSPDDSRSALLLGVANISSPVARGSHRNTLDALSMPALRDATIPIDFRK